MHPRAVDEVEEHLFQRGTLALQVRQRDARGRGDRAELSGLGAADGETGAQRVVVDACGIERRRESGPVGGVDHGRIVAGLREPRHVALVDEAPAGDDEQRRHGLLHFGQHVRRDEDRPALPRERPEEAAQPADALGVEPVRRFVEDQHAGVAEQGVRESEALAHAERESADLPPRDIGEADEAEHLVDAPLRDARGTRVHAEVVHGRAARVEARRLERGTHRVQGMGEIGVALAADGRGARGGPHEPQHDAQARGLAGAVRAEEAGHGARLHARREPVDRRHRPEALGHVGELEHVSVGHGGTSRRRWRSPHPGGNLRAARVPRPGEAEVTLPG